MFIQISLSPTIRIGFFFRKEVTSRSLGMREGNRLLPVLANFGG